MPLYLFSSRNNNNNNNNNKPDEMSEMNVCFIRHVKVDVEGCVCSDRSFSLHRYKSLYGQLCSHQHHTNLFRGENRVISARYCTANIEHLLDKAMADMEIYSVETSNIGRGRRPRLDEYYTPRVNKLRYSTEGYGIFAYY